MAAEGRANHGGPRERRPAIWPWVLMPLIVLLVFAALLRMHHRPGAPWAAAWTHPSSSDESPQRTP